MKVISMVSTYARLLLLQAAWLLLTSRGSHSGLLLFLSGGASLLFLFSRCCGLLASRGRCGLEGLLTGSWVWAFRSLTWFCFHLVLGQKT